jgi:chromosome partitioning protein
MTNPLIITCASSKGGVGKSTTAACLAGAFAKSGETVHLIDLDSNRTLSRWFNDDAIRPRAITVTTPDPEKLSEHLKKLGADNGPDVILIDIAGLNERGLTVAIARSHLTLIPATLSEADVFEASRVAHLIQTVYARFGAKPLYRVLLTRVQTITSHAQRYAMSEIKRLQLPMLTSLLVQRAAYEEIGLSGLPPHYADPKRSTVAGAVAELDTLLAEIKAIVAPHDTAASPKTANKSRIA